MRITRLMVAAAAALAAGAAAAAPVYPTFTVDTSALAGGGSLGTFVANDRYKSIPGAVFRFGNLPAMINADVHSGEDVILTATGPGSDGVRGQLDNTDVFRLMVEALGLGAASGADARQMPAVPASR